MEQVILDHWSSGVIAKAIWNARFDDDGNISSDFMIRQPNSLISLFGIFPNFVREGKILISNNSNYFEGDYLFGSQYHIRINGYLEGVLLFMEEGKIVSKKEYRHGMKNGVWNYWGLDGNLRETGEYKNNKKEKIWKRWNPYNKQKIEGNYLQTYYENGVVISKGNIQNKERVGYWEYSDGKKYNTDTV